MALIPYQQYFPLATVAVWWSLAAYQVYRDRFRTWTEVFFLAACIFAGAYAFSDVLFFTVPTPEAAALAAKASFSVLLFAIMFLFLFSLVFYTRMRRSYAAAVVPAFAMIVFLWLYLVPVVTPGEGLPITSLNPGCQPPNPSCPPWVGDWDPTTFTIYVIVVLVYSIGAALFLYLTYREVARQTVRLRRRMLGLLVATLLCLLLGTMTNTLRSFTNQQVLPLFSTALVLPGIVAFVTLSPMSRERFSVAVRRWKASRYDIKAAFVIFTDGTLIGAKVKPGEKVIDQDLFGATLDVIQNFMRTSFPTLRGSLSAIKHGDFTLVMERGRYAYLTIILQGEENDQLRRHMRDLLLKYERDNQPVLADWRGMPSEAIGTDAMLGDLVENA